jgi:hypothetical protein
MKRSKDNYSLLQLQKYTKLLAWVALQTILLVSCQLLENKATHELALPIAETIVIEEDSIEVRQITEVQNNYQKAKSSSGSSVSPVSSSAEVFSEEELRKVASRLPTMNPREAAKIEEKLKKSIAYYDSKK